MNRRLLHLVARLYPRAWRERYGIEFQALLNQATPGWCDVLDVLKGGLQMHLRRTHPALVAAALSVVGACAAATAAVGTSDRVVSTGTMYLRRTGPSTDPAATRAEDVMQRLARNAFDRDALTGIIDRYDLYAINRAQSSKDASVHRMRDDIRVQFVSPTVLRVSFASSDSRKAQRVAQDLMAQLVRANATLGASSVVQVLDPADEPQASTSPRRVALAGVAGFGGGAVIGALMWFQRRRVSPRAS